MKLSAAQRFALDLLNTGVYIAPTSRGVAIRGADPNWLRAVGLRIGRSTLAALVRGGLAEPDGERSRLRLTDAGRAALRVDSPATKR